MGNQINHTPNILFPQKLGQNLQQHTDWNVRIQTDFCTTKYRKLFNTKAANEHFVQANRLAHRWELFRPLFPTSKHSHA